jgi:hypothetical protein
MAELPLPQVVADVGPGGQVVTSMRGINALLSDLYGSQSKKAEAEYAPYTAYADAASKIAYANMLPYQIQSSVLSNPYVALAFQNNPDAYYQMINNLMKSVPQGNQLPGGVSIPLPNQPSGNSLWSMFMSKITGNEPSTNAMQQIPSTNTYPSQSSMPYPAPNTNTSIPPSSLSNNTSSYSTNDEPVLLSPASKGTPQGVIGSQTAKFVEQPYTQGKTATINGRNISVPAGNTVNDVQRAYVGIKNAEPLLNNIAGGAEEFLGKGTKGKLLATQLNGLAKQYGGFDLIPEESAKNYGLDEDQLSRYAQWRAQIEQAPEPLMSAFNLPKDEMALKKVSKIVEPIPGESGKGYKQRVLNEISQLTGKRLPLYKAILSSGIPLSNNQSLSQGEKILSKSVVLPKFSSREEFQNWYKNQEPFVQKAIMANLQRSNKSKEG